MRLSFTRFLRVTTTPNNLGFISIRIFFSGIVPIYIPVFLLFSFIEKIVKIIFNSHALSRQRNAERILKITVEPPSSSFLHFWWRKPYMKFNVSELTPKFHIDKTHAISNFEQKFQIRIPRELVQSFYITGFIINQFQFLELMILNTTSYLKG